MKLTKILMTIRKLFTSWKVIKEQCNYEVYTSNDTKHPAEFLTRFEVDVLHEYFES
jgi:hypothetical protein